MERKLKKKRIIKIIFAILLALLLVVIIGCYLMFSEIIKAAGTVREIEPGLYVMEYKGDYGFEDFLNKGGAKSDAEVASYLTEFLSKGFYKQKVSAAEYGCTTLCTLGSNGSVLYGRNYDWSKGDAMIIHTVPNDGYESFATCSLDFLGFGENYRPDENMVSKMMSLASIYVSLDGINEKGLAIADLVAGDKEVTNQNTDKVDLTTTTAIRLVLDKAATVDEAVELLSEYDMHSSIGSAHHFSIADATGKSVVVEYIDGKMYVTETDVVTNFYLTECEKYGTGSEQSHIRFDTIKNALESDDNKTESNVMDMLESVSQSNYPQTDGSYEITMWSISYNLTECTADFCFMENYSHSYKLSFNNVDWMG